MEFSIPVRHPSLAGHFPDHPIVPAVVILEEVVVLLAKFSPGARITCIVSAKFTGLLQPEQLCRVRFERRGDGAVRFSCESEGRPIASGILEIAGSSP